MEGFEIPAEVVRSEIPVEVAVEVAMEEEVEVEEEAEVEVVTAVGAVEIENRQEEHRY